METRRRRAPGQREEEKVHDVPRGRRSTENQRANVMAMRHRLPEPLTQLPPPPSPPKQIAASAPCPSCARVAFCSQACLSTSTGPPAFHTPGHCAALTRAAAHEAGLAHDSATSLRFLLAVAALQAAASTSPEGSAARAAWAAFDSLSAPPALPCILSATPLLTPIVAFALSPAWPAPLPTPDVVAVWLAREASNAFGVLCAPAAAGSGPPGALGRRSPSIDPAIRSLRGSGLYATASRFNHACLPSAARFDAFDGGTPGPERTLIEVRALHALPAGEEVTLSYFPLDWELQERSTRLSTEYGFVCTCARCALERGSGEDGQLQQPPPALQPRRTLSMPDVAGRSLRPSDESMAAASASARGSAGSVLPDAAAVDFEAPADPGYVGAFLAKFCCAACSGTLAPVVPGGGEGDHVCNVCGVVRSHAEFIKEMEDDDDGDEWSGEDGME